MMDPVHVVDCDIKEVEPNKCQKYYYLVEGYGKFDYRGIFLYNYLEYYLRNGDYFKN